MVANWMMQTSFRPRQVALGLEQASYTHGRIEKGGVFAINLFLKSGAEVLKPFMRVDQGTRRG